MESIWLYDYMTAWVLTRLKVFFTSLGHKRFWKCFRSLPFQNTKAKKKKSKLLILYANSRLYSGMNCEFWTLEACNTNLLNSLTFFPAWKVSNKAVDRGYHCRYVIFKQWHKSKSTSIQIKCWLSEFSCS